jgi:hypothetical protein
VACCSVALAIVPGFASGARCRYHPGYKLAAKNAESAELSAALLFAVRVRGQHSFVGQPSRLSAALLFAVRVRGQHSFVGQPSRLSAAQEQLLVVEMGEGSAF